MTRRPPARVADTEPGDDVPAAVRVKRRVRVIVAGNLRLRLNAGDVYSGEMATLLWRDAREAVEAVEE